MRHARLTGRQRVEDEFPLLRVVLPSEGVCRGLHSLAGLARGVGVSSRSLTSARRRLGLPSLRNVGQRRGSRRIDHEILRRMGEGENMASIAREMRCTRQSISRRVRRLRGATR